MAETMASSIHDDQPRQRAYLANKRLFVQEIEIHHVVRVSQQDTCTMLLANECERNGFFIPRTSDMMLTVGKQSPVRPF
jgi:hypothetical protein